MRSQIAITDVTRMGPPKVCVAGYLPDGTCVRPTFRGGPVESWLFSKGRQVVKPFAVIECGLLRKRMANRAPHTEDWEIQADYLKCYDLTPANSRELLKLTRSPTVRSIFGTFLHGDQPEGK